MTLPPSNGHSTDLLARFPGLYEQLRALAHAQLAGERPGHTLNTTALAHEAYIRLTDQQKLNTIDRAQFSIAAAATIRRVLVDYARARNAAKRCQIGLQQIPLENLTADSPSPALDLLDLDDALNELAIESSRAVQLVELRFFAGLTIEEAADASGISRRTAINEWTMARGWLRRRLRDYRDDIK